MTVYLEVVYNAAQVGVIGTRTHCIVGDSRGVCSAEPQGVRSEGI